MAHTPNTLCDHKKHPFHTDCIEIVPSWVDKSLHRITCTRLHLRLLRSNLENMRRTNLSSRWAWSSHLDTGCNWPHAQLTILVQLDNPSTRFDPRMIEIGQSDMVHISIGVLCCWNTLLRINNNFYTLYDLKETNLRFSITQCGFKWNLKNFTCKMSPAGILNKLFGQFGFESSPSSSLCNSPSLLECLLSRNRTRSTTYLQSY